MFGLSKDEKNIQSILKQHVFWEIKNEDDLNWSSVEIIVYVEHLCSSEKNGSVEGGSGGLMTEYFYCIVEQISCFKCCYPLK